MVALESFERTAVNVQIHDNILISSESAGLLVPWGYTSNELNVYSNLI